MIKCLQINLHCCKAAQALMHESAANKQIDFAFVSEFNRTEGNSWYTDKEEKAALMNISNLRLDDTSIGKDGFRWIAIGGMRLYSCYLSPNMPLAVFHAFVK